MSKYDFEIDLSTNTSTGMILSQIRPGSVVLEFGCATGRMTRYMKEAMGCQVYIVEYDPGAFEVARQYAEDGLCDDILTFRWAEKFREITFDAIIFADVLEHLSAPERVMEAAAKLLKDTGCVYVSVPNVTHNDVLLKACQERFDYTGTGLLDDTHIHFWGMENIKELGGKCGLHLRSLEGTYCTTGDTEQGTPVRDRLLENILRQRPCGEVYQFVATFDKIGAQQPAVTFRVPAVRSHIYLDRGNGFHAAHMICVESEPVGPGIYRCHAELEDTAELQAIRLDPVEFQGCIVRSMSVCQPEALPLHYVNGVALEEGVLLSGDDPMICVQVLPENGPVTVDAEFVLPGAGYMQLLEGGCAGLQIKVEKLTEDHRVQMESMTAVHRTAIEQMTAEKKGLQKDLQDMTDARDDLQKTADRLEADKAELQRDVCAYIILANNKEKYALEVERERDAAIARAENRIRQLEAEVSRYENMKIVKMRAFAARIYKAVKRRIKRLLRKE